VITVAGIWAETSPKKNDDSPLLVGVPVQGCDGKVKVTTFPVWVAEIGATRPNPPEVMTKT